MNLEKMFDKHDEEYLKFDRIENPPHNRPDLCAFILLDKLSPSERARDIIACSEHDEFWIDASPEDVANNATEEDIIYLQRCGIRYDSSNDSFCMFS